MWKLCFENHNIMPIQPLCEVLDSKEAAVRAAFSKMKLVHLKVRL
jgi:hypothetical protein